MMSHKSVDKDLSNHGEGNSSSSTKYPKFISFSVNNKSGHFEQLVIALEMI